MKQLDFNLLFLWFVVQNMDEAVWNHSAFSQNRDRLLTETFAHKFFSRVVTAAESYGLLSGKYFNVSYTSIDAWASKNSFRPKDKTKKKDSELSSDSRDPDVDLKGSLHGNSTHVSMTYSEAKYIVKENATKPGQAFMVNALMENNPGLIIDAETTKATDIVERRAGFRMSTCYLKAQERRQRL